MVARNKRKILARTKYYSRDLDIHSVHDYPITLKRMRLPVDAVLRKVCLFLFKIIKITLRLLRELLKLMLKLLWKICKGLIIWTMVYERVRLKSPGRLEQRETDGTWVDLLEVTNL